MFTQLPGNQYRDVYGTVFTTPTNTAPTTWGAPITTYGPNGERYNGQWLGTHAGQKRT